MEETTTSGQPQTWKVYSVKPMANPASAIENRPEPLQLSLLNDFLYCRTLRLSPCRHCCAAATPPFVCPVER
jgi:hypothetical protein